MTSLADEIRKIMHSPIEMPVLPVLDNKVSRCARPPGRRRRECSIYCPLIL